MTFTLLRWSLNGPRLFIKCIQTQPYQKCIHTNNILSCKIEGTKKLRTFVLGRYVDYVKGYEKVLETKFPSAMRFYRVFMVGVRDFYTDLKMFLKIVKIVNTPGNTLKALNRKEIELYDKLPKDMIRVAPVLLISALPFANYVIFPLAFYFPRHLLSSHFWSIQQRSDFAVIHLRNRLKHLRPIYACVQERYSEIVDEEQREYWSKVLGTICCGLQPTAHELINCNQLFTSKPYHLDQLHANHIKELLKFHSLHRGWFRRKRLSDRAKIINEMDLAILREGGVHNMPVDALRNACFIRGFNPSNVSHTEMVVWLTEWVKVSKTIDKTNLSLLLHCPMFLGFNQPSNWQLLYCK